MEKTSERVGGDQENQLVSNLHHAERSHDELGSFIERSGDAAIKSGQLAIRTVTLINGGAVIAVLGFISALASKDSERCARSYEVALVFGRSGYGGSRRRFCLFNELCSDGRRFAPTTDLESSLCRGYCRIEEMAVVCNCVSVGCCPDGNPFFMLLRHWYGECRGRDQPFAVIALRLNGWSTLCRP
jgi:hypothetical protein